MVKASTQYKREHKADYGHEKLDILFEDQWIIVINKPSGMLSVPYPGSRARTAQAVLEALLRKRGALTRQHKPLCVHRLDRDTSGVMMFALTEEAQAKIMASWHQMVTERLYRAVAENPQGKHAVPLPDSGLIDAPLAFNAHNVGFVPQADAKPKTALPRSSHSRAGMGNGSSKGERSLYERHVSGSGNHAQFKTVPARTHFTVVQRGQTHTLFELSLDTGKKNQIRAHLASKGYPLAGDENFRAHTDPFGRLALHARTLEFTHPFTGKKMQFEVPEPEEWEAYVIRGDKNPTLPVWQKAYKAQFSAPHAYAPQAAAQRQHAKTAAHAHTAHELQSRAPRLRRREEAHLDFIERGKRR